MDTYKVSVRHLVEWRNMMKNIFNKGKIICRNNRSVFQGMKIMSKDIYFWRVIK